MFIILSIFCVMCVSKFVPFCFRFPYKRFCCQVSYVVLQQTFLFIHRQTELNEGDEGYFVCESLVFVYG